MKKVLRYCIGTTICVILGLILIFVVQKPLYEFNADWSVRYFFQLGLATVVLGLLYNLVSAVIWGWRGFRFKRIFRGSVPDPDNWKSRESAILHVCIVILNLLSKFRTLAEREKQALRGNGLMPNVKLVNQAKRTFRRAQNLAQAYNYPLPDDMDRLEKWLVKNIRACSVDPDDIGYQ